MPQRIVLVGDQIGIPKGERGEGYALFDRYKDTWVQEVMDEQDEHFCDDVFHSYEEYMEFWGAENLDEAQGSVYGKLYKNWSKEDVDFYAKVVEDADERDKNNIKILKGGWEEFKAVKRRMKMMIMMMILIYLFSIPSTTFYIFCGLFTLLVCNQLS